MEQFSLKAQLQLNTPQCFIHWLHGNGAEQLWFQTHSAAGGKEGTRLQELTPHLCRNSPLTSAAPASSPKADLLSSHLQQTV